MLPKRLHASAVSWIVISAAAAPLSLAGCGPEGNVLVRVEASCGGAACRVPDDIDSLRLVTFALRDGVPGDRLADELVPLGAGDTFPYTILLEASDSTPHFLRQVVTVAKDGIDVASGAYEHRWKRGRLTEVAVAVVVPP